MDEYIREFRDYQQISATGNNQAQPNLRYQPSSGKTLATKNASNNNLKLMQLKQPGHSDVSKSQIFTKLIHSDTPKKSETVA